ncbi:hypothetical protein BO82DRAFT_435382 [Aspergillus uvarum CBS 121591]|uniref:Uncharacterized protein n=1 Tax=Aspergillus uvarum CBS 121591 TaxID=1448315 RepID=A0A319CQZ9_9EURO|nr:hypothetical protein BO82DRAFT_435382 [Aspergillus uvarum CBS 121591]PYH77958.1 hypothetical protein BO82DRAFT_435382 [Aspergillus uvarum CBS 121591]
MNSEIQTWLGRKPRASLTSSVLQHSRKFSLLFFTRPPGKTRDQMLFEQILNGTISDRDCSKFWKSVFSRSYSRDTAKAKSSHDGSESEDYFLELPWNDVDILANIPDLFTVEVTGTNDENCDIQCECQTCRKWVRAMYRAYRKPRFCVRRIENPADMHFYRRRDIPWPSCLSEAKNG